MLQSKTSANRTLVGTGGAEAKKRTEMKHRLITKSTTLEDVLTSSTKIQHHSVPSSRLLKAVSLFPS